MVELVYLWVNEPKDFQKVFHQLHKKTQKRYKRPQPSAWFHFFNYYPLNISFHAYIRSPGLLVSAKFLKLYYLYLHTVWQITFVCSLYFYLFSVKKFMQKEISAKEKSPIFIDARLPLILTFKFQKYTMLLG